MNTTLSSSSPGPSVREPHAACRLILQVNGRHYTVRPTPVADASFGITRAYRLLRIDSGDVYDVAVHRDGHRECTCPDHIYRREGIDPAGCKHARALASLGLFG
jgi:hypothetical protein